MFCKIRGPCKLILLLQKAYLISCDKKLKVSTRHLSVQRIGHALAPASRTATSLASHDRVAPSLYGQSCRNQCRTAERPTPTTVRTSAPVSGLHSSQTRLGPCDTIPHILYAPCIHTLPAPTHTREHTAKRARLALSKPGLDGKLSARGSNSWKSRRTTPLCTRFSGRVRV